MAGWEDGFDWKPCGFFWKMLLGCGLEEIVCFFPNKIYLWEFEPERRGSEGFFGLILDLIGNRFL